MFWCSAYQSKYTRFFFCMLYTAGESFTDVSLRRSVRLEIVIPCRILVFTIHDQWYFLHFLPLESNNEVVSRWLLHRNSVYHSVYHLYCLSIHLGLCPFCFNVILRKPLPILSLVLGSPWVFDFFSTTHICEVFPYPPSGEAHDASMWQNSAQIYIISRLAFSKA